MTGKSHIAVGGYPQVFAHGDGFEVGRGFIRAAAFESRESSGE
jgi:hypothetical protein